MLILSVILQKETVKPKQRRQHNSWSISSKEFLIQMPIYLLPWAHHHHPSRQTFRIGIG
jgi:hypothetical protein